MLLTNANLKYQVTIIKSIPNIICLIADMINHKASRDKRESVKSFLNSHQGKLCVYVSNTTVRLLNQVFQLED